MPQKDKNDDSVYCNPIIATFENGQPNQADRLKCAVLRNNSNKRRIVTAATDKLIYTGVDQTENDICHTLILVRNKRTSKIRVIPINNISLKPVLPNENVSTSLNASFNTKRNVTELNREFGNKKLKRKTEQMERMKMNISNVEKELENTVVDIKIKKEDLVAPVDNEAVNSYRPPINRNASKVELVYTLDTIIAHDELDTLTEIAEEVLENDFENDKFSTFVTECITLIKKLKPPNKLQKCKIFLYIDAILKFFKIPIKSISKSFILEPYSEVITMKINQEFTLRTDNGRSRPLSMRDKATCYILVLSLIALDYKLDLESLSKSIGVGIKKLCDFSRVIGAQTELNKPKNCICLKLPIPPEPSLFNRRRK